MKTIAKITHRQCVCKVLVYGSTIHNVNHHIILTQRISNSYQIERYDTSVELEFSLERVMRFAMATFLVTLICEQLVV